MKWRFQQNIQRNAVTTGGDGDGGRDTDGDGEWNKIISLQILL